MGLIFHTKVIIQNGMILSNLLSLHSDVNADNYYLLVESLDTEVVAFAPMLASSYPRVIAVGEGNGDLLRVTLLLPEDCRAKRNNQYTKQVCTSMSFTDSLAEFQLA